jgi:gliding motility-associated-like protein
LSDKDQIKELFSQKLGQYEANVRPELWANVASQMNVASSAAASSGLSLVSKIIIGFTAAGVITTGVIVFTNNEKVSEKNETPVLTQAQGQQKTQEVPVPLKQRSSSSNATDNNPKEIVPTEDKEFVLQFQAEPEEDVVGIENTIDKQEETAKEIAKGEQVTTVKEMEATPQKTPNNSNEASNAKPPMKVDPTDQITQEDDPVHSIGTVNENEKEQPFELINLPNVFTPDGDGTNDFFFLELPELSTFKIMILDQNGETVFESNDPNFKWDGSDIRTGNRVKKGIHSYIIIAENKKGQVAKAREFLMITFD